MGSFFHGPLCTSWATWGGENEQGDNMRAVEEPNPEGEGPLGCTKASRV